MQIKFYFSEMFAFDRIPDKKGLIDHTSVTTPKRTLYGYVGIFKSFNLSCADPESFVRGGSTLTMFFLMIRGGRFPILN